MQFFSVLGLAMNATCDGMNFTHLTQLMLLQYLVKNRNTGKCNIAVGYNQRKFASNVPYSFIEMDLQIIKFGVLCSSECTKQTKICDIGDLQKRLMQTWFDFEQNVIDAAIVKWRDRLRSCESVDAIHFEHMV